jgi:hypothetical protein
MIDAAQENANTAVEGGHQTLERLAEWLATEHASVAP